MIKQRARHKGAYGGRGSAKSHSFASALVIEGYYTKQMVACFREVQNSIKDSVKALLDMKINEYGLRDFYRSTDEGIFGNNGTRFIFKGLHGNANIQAVKSTEGITRAWVEEAQSVSQASIEILIPTVRAPGSEIWWSWNPNAETDPVDVLLRDPSVANDNDYLVRKVNYSDNPYFPEELRREMERDKRRDPDKYQHVWLGGYRRASNARVFRNWRIEEFETPDSARFYQGADWGFAIDPSVLVRCFLVDRKLYIDYEAYQVGCEIDDLPKLFAGRDGADEKELAAWGPGDDNKWPGVPRAKKVTICADSARPETISFMKRKGFLIGAALKGKGSVEDGISWLQNYDIIVHPRCKRTIDELSFYSWKVDPKIIDPVTKNPLVLNELADKDNHVIDSLRYAVESIRRGQPLPITKTFLQRAHYQQRQRANV